MLSWMALDTDPIWLGLELAPEHTKSWRRPGMHLGSLVGRNGIKVLVELEILKKLGIHLMEEERMVSR